MITYIALIITGYLLALFFINGGFRPNKSPAFYRGWVPFFGAAIDIGMEGFAKFVETRAAANGGIFSAYVLGQTQIFIADAESFVPIWKDPRIGFGPSLKKASDRLRGFELEDNGNDNEELETRSEELRKLTVSGLQGDELAKLTIVYQKLADEKIEEMTKNTTNFNLMDFTKRVVYTASAKALLEETFDTEGTFEDFFYYDAMAPLLVLGFPSWLLPRVTKARDHVIKEIEKCDFDKLSLFVKHGANRDVIRGHGKFKAYTMMSFLFASQTNSVNSSFWLMGYILNNKNIKDKVMKEIEEFYDPLDVKSVDKMETLANSFVEISRMVEGHLSFRDALEDANVTIGGEEYLISKRDTIFLFPTTLMNEKVFENPETFKPDRHKYLSKIAKQTMIPFGGGKHLCPGRYFAANEAKLFVISLLTQFDCELDNVPFPEPSRMSPGFLTPVNDIGVTFTKKSK